MGRHGGPPALPAVPAEFVRFHTMRPKHPGATPTTGTDEHLAGQDVNRQETNTENRVK